MVAQHGLTEWWAGHATAQPARRAMIRVVRARTPDKQTLLQRFHERAAQAVKVDHPSLVGTQAAGIEDTQAWAAMNVVDGCTLEALIRLSATLPQPLPMGFVCDVMADVLDALSAIHHAPNAVGRPMIHGGLEPKRIRINSQGEVRVGGLARELPEPGSVGLYFPPEHFRQEPMEPRSDLFTAGLIFYELLVRARPFPGADEASSRTAMLYQPIPSPRERLPTLPPALDGLVMEMLTRDRFTRPESASKLARRLRTLSVEGQMAAPARAEWLKPYWPQLLDRNLHTSIEIAAMTGTPSPTTTPPPSKEPANPLRWVAIGALVFGVCGAGIGVFQLWQSMHPSQVPVDMSGGMKPIPGLPTAPVYLAPLTPGSHAAATGAAATSTSGVTVKTASSTMPSSGSLKIKGPSGTLTLITSPPVQVLFKNRLLGTTPILNVPLPVGSHRLQLKFADGRRQPYPVTIQAGGHAQFRLDLK
jgi:serine/threonine-protein kinase